ncbi:MAG: aminomethyltransferase family protein [Caldilineaceae bacterium]|nr:aminomethyltransferase family protein [Caldilineaceae bacterium]
MTITTTIDKREYTALHSGAALHLRADRGLLQLTGADRVDFVQRMTTNNIVILEHGQSAVTVLTSPIARIQYVFTVLQRGDLLWLLPAGDDVEQLSRHLRSQIFFMDKVKVESLSEGFRRMRLMGPDASSLLTEIGLPTPSAEWFAEQDGIVVLHQAAFDVPGYELIVPVAESEAVQRRLLDAGAMLLADEDAYTARRVELGRPAPGHELVEEYNPLEAGLAWSCAENKGCYTGQEIIARQITYDKVTKTLVGLRNDDPLAAGAEVKLEGRAVGAVTSAAYSPTLEGHLALAVIKRPHNSAGTVVDINGQQVTVIQLPFL